MGIQVIEKSEDKTAIDTVVARWLIKGKDPSGRDFIRYDEHVHNGTCIAYRMIRVISNNLLEVSEYHYCQDFEDLEEEKGLWAYVETDASTIELIKTFRDFNEIYQKLYECIKRQNGWGKTVKCE
jgi:hypothetical protein